jgi:hypothetical protein
MTLEVLLALDYYTEAKDFAMCADLQLRQSRLDGFKNSFPFPPEIRRDLIELNSRLETAVKAKNFKLCAELNEAIANEEKELLQLDESSFLEFYTLEELSLREKELTDALNAAVANKSFEQGARIQATLEKISSQISVRHVAKEVVESTLLKLESNAAEFRSQKNFCALASMAMKLGDVRWMNAELQKRKPAQTPGIAARAEAPSIYASYSYEELTEAIRVNKMVLGESVAQKQYSR